MSNKTEKEYVLQIKGVHFSQHKNNDFRAQKRIIPAN